MAEQKAEFYRQLEQVGSGVTPILAAHGVRSLPSGGQLPKASITAAEAASAFGYVSSPTLAKQMNRLMRAQSWAALMSEFGPVVKALMGYIQKIEKVSAAKRTLFRGMRLPEEHIQEQYVVGRIVTWHAFGSVTTHRPFAESYCCEDYDRGFFFDDSVPVVFVISTHYRGALVGGWSPHAHDELLLAPFLCFQITAVERVDATRVIKMEVVKLRRSWTETAPDRLILLHPGSMPWAPPAKEVLSELEEDADESIRRKLDPPGASLLAALVAWINFLLMLLYVADYDLDDFKLH